jgi:hypothetical protein
MKIRKGVIAEINAMQEYADAGQNKAYGTQYVSLYLNSKNELDIYETYCSIGRNSWSETYHKLIYVVPPTNTREILEQWEAVGKYKIGS